MNRPTAWPSFSEYGAFEKSLNEWHTLLCTCQCLHTKSSNYVSQCVAEQTKFACLCVEVVTKEVLKLIPQH